MWVSMSTSLSFSRAPKRHDPCVCVRTGILWNALIHVRGITHLKKQPDYGSGDPSEMFPVTKDDCHQSLFKTIGIGPKASDNLPLKSLGKKSSLKPDKT